MKSKVRGVADAAILQCVVYDSKSRKRAIAVYACGDDVIWADNVLSLFDVDKRKVAPTWLKEQIRSLPADALHFNWKGERVVVREEGGVRLETPDLRTKVPEDKTPLAHVSDGEGLDEDDIKQG